VIGQLGDRLDDLLRKGSRTFCRYLYRWRHLERPPLPSFGPRLLITPGPRRAFSTERWISAAPQSQPWSARRDGTAHSAYQEGRRYRVRRRANDSVPFSSLATGRASRSWCALRT